MKALEKLALGIGVAVIAIVLAAVTSILFAFPVKWCWNYTMPFLFGLKCITFGQAWCLNFLAGCLIKSIQTSK